MPLPDLSLLPRVEVIHRSATFTDVRCPGLSIDVTFGFMPFQSDVDIYFLTEKTAELVKKYVTDNVPIIVQGGARVPVSEKLCLAVAAFMLSEKATGTESLTPEEDWFRFSVLAPTAWREMNDWYVAQDKEISGDGEGNEAPNFLGAEEV